MNDVPAPPPHDGFIAIGRSGLEELIEQARACTLCAANLPREPRPVLLAGHRARVLVVGHAPGTRVHATGIPWNDPSGETLRAWMDVDRETFYDPERFAIIPTGLCYPGRGRSGDLPPRPECAPRWHPPLRAALPDIRLTLLLGAHAQAYYLNRPRGTLTERVVAWERYLAGERTDPATGPVLPLPHPSPRNRRWIRQRPWFEAEVIPALRRALATAFSDSGDV